MGRTFYGEPDYVFARKMLDLRTSLGLTQEGLAAALGLTRKTISRWESGERYPNAVRLQALLTLALQQGGFPAGQEAARIRTFWNAAHQKVLLDEAWLAELLRQPSSSQAGEAGEPSSGSEQDRAGASPPLALWTVPYARNPHFTGREELLSELERRLAPKETGQSTTLQHAALTQSQAIKGLGGIGKTQTAIEYSYRAREQRRYTHTLWINAASEETILMSFVALAEQLPNFAPKGETDQRKLVAAIIRWLQQCQEPWLLIFDNADELSVVQPYLPLQGQGSILLTTRAAAVGALASPLEVDVMGMLEGTELLLRRAQRFAQISDEEINEATNLVVTLGQFPLALDQAGAYIEETGCSLQAYLQLYQTHRHALLARRGRQATGYPASVATTWSLSFTYIEQKSPAAASLLQLCALLAPDHIPEELLTGGTPYWSPALQEATADPFRFNQILETLLAFSLIKRLGGERQLSIHRLVQAVQQERLSHQERHRWAERLVCAVEKVFPRDPEEPSSWPVCVRYLEQVQEVSQLIREYQILLPQAVSLLQRTGVYFSEHALYALAEESYQQALSLLEQQQDIDSADLAQTQRYLANLYYNQNRYEEAVPLYGQALYILEQQKHIDSFQIAMVLKSLANISNNQARYGEAEQLYLQALRLLDQTGEEGKPAAPVLSGLSWVYVQQGKYEQAEQSYQRALSIQTRLSGPEHLNVTSPLTGLAVVYTQWGRYEQAESLYRRALHIREKHLGPEHPTVAFSLHELAKSYAGQGKYEEAEPLFQRALRICEHQLGPENLQVSSPLRGLAALYSEQGKYEEAEPLFQRALHIREQRLGPENSEVVEVLVGLAHLYTQQGQYEEAEPLFQRALRIREQLGPKHLETANALHHFAGFQQAQGRTQEAAIMYQRALTTREHLLGSDHPQTIETRTSLQAVLMALGWTQEAASMAGAHEQEEMAPVPNQMPEA